MKTLLGYFLRGCLALLPIAATIYVAVTVVMTIDRWLPVGIPGAGFALTISLITLAGFLTSNVVGRAVLEVTDRLLTQVPLAKLIYTSIRDLLGAFMGEKKRFDRPVAVTMMPGSQIRMLGFVTRERLDVLGGRNEVAVYFPQSYNFAGYLAIVPRDQVEPLSVSTTDLMTFVVSGGVSGFGIEPDPVSRATRKNPQDRTLLGLGGRKQ